MRSNKKSVSAYANGSLLVIIPAFNEEKSIGQVVAKAETLWNLVVNLLPLLENRLACAAGARHDAQAVLALRSTLRSQRWFHSSQLLALI